ncbi:MAG TPA: uracil phosphoribosyltransferase [Baekduia sp.]|jgi:uracil phosphoribosyltransferase|uniref:uracil phosphoribosyltransferase n=1 Tax=Baekduia sp. TaxID=2600305 RepID=UPI002BEBCEE6|nr:uracil phosphoribosyltransferase [Baekduia sp.]HMJ35136.1 uracil phosphoribosyltransferase [Baekduia sp.]
MAGLRVVDHPVMARAVTELRAAETSRAAFRSALADASSMLAYEALRDLPVREVEVETPLERTTGSTPAPVMVIAVLRAGLGMVDGFLRFVPDAAIGHLGMRRNEQTLQPEDYYESLPEGVERSTVFVVDPMLATGGSATAALHRMRRAGATDLRLVCLVCAPEGVATVQAAHPDVPILAAVQDRGLDERGYIRPGLGDAGDRLFGTD